MKILFIEDDDEKRKKISDFLHESFTGILIIDKKSYNSGLLGLVSGEQYDFVLMDMSMPNFDISQTDSEGGTPESFAGRDLLEQMKFRNIVFSTIIITQFDAFGERSNKLSLDELKFELEKKYSPTYQGTVYYHSSESNWKIHLKEMILKTIKGIIND